MDRRRFVAMIGSALTAPLARAQAPAALAPKTIGFLDLQPDSGLPPAERPLPKALATFGWIVGQNLAYERAFADLKIERLAGLVQDMLRKRVDVLVTNGPEATLAAARATKTVPIVFFGVTWPVEQGFIDSFARPGRNLTGLAFYTGVEVTNKRLEFLREVAPAAKRLSWLWPPEFTETLSGGRFDMQSVLRSASTGLGFETRFHDVKSSEDVERAFVEAAAWRAQAVTAGGAHVYVARQRVAELALRQRLPTAFPFVDNVDAGGLLAYGPAASEFALTFSRAAMAVDRILRGANPAEIPVERPSRYELVINRKTANALGLKIPQSLILRADRVIE